MILLTTILNLVIKSDLTQIAIITYDGNFAPNCGCLLRTTCIHNIFLFPYRTASRICDQTSLVPTSPSLHTQISVKSERASPTASCSSAVPQLSTSVRSNLSGVPTDLHHQEDYIKGYHYSFLLSRPLSEEPRQPSVASHRLPLAAAEEWQK